MYSAHLLYIAMHGYIYQSNVASLSDHCHLAIPYWAIICILCFWYQERDYKLMWYSLTPLRIEAAFSCRRSILILFSLDQCLPNFCFKDFMQLLYFFLLKLLIIHLLNNIVPDLVWLRSPWHPSLGSTALDISRLQL